MHTFVSVIQSESEPRGGRIGRGLSGRAGWVTATFQLIFPTSIVLRVSNQPFAEVAFLTAGITGEDPLRPKKKQQKNQSIGRGRAIPARIVAAARGDQKKLREKYEAYLQWCQDFDVDNIIEASQVRASPVQRSVS